jgi:hypothetical protein
MSNKARIEYRTHFGVWRYFTTVTNLGSNVRNALQNALRSQNCAGKARAVDEEDGSIIDIEQE